MVSIYHLSKRICPCFRPKQAFDHNQFDPNYKHTDATNYIIHIDDNIKKKHTEKKPEQKPNNELNKDLEKKLVTEPVDKGKKKEEGGYGSANSKEKLVTSWLGRHQAVLQGQPVQTVQGVERRPGKVRKFKVKPQPVMLVPAHPASTVSCKSVFKNY